MDGITLHTFVSHILPARFSLTFCTSASSVNLPTLSGVASWCNLVQVRGECTPLSQVLPTRSSRACLSAPLHRRRRGTSGCCYLWCVLVTVCRTFWCHCVWLVLVAFVWFKA